MPRAAPAGLARRSLRGSQKSAARARRPAVRAARRSRRRWGQATRLSHPRRRTAAAPRRKSSRFSPPFERCAHADLSPSAAIREHSRAVSKDRSLRPLKLLRRVFSIEGSDVPVVGAPMAGGPTTPRLAAAVSEAGGLGFLAAGYQTPAEVRAAIAAVRSISDRPFGVNLFYPTRDETDEAAIEAYAASLHGEEERYGVRVGDHAWHDDEWDGKLDVVAEERPDVVSFTFGCPPENIVKRLHACDVAVWATVTSPAEARTALAAGVDALVLQGTEAGGHQASFRQHDDEPITTLTLLQLTAAAPRPRDREPIHARTRPKRPGGIPRGALPDGAAAVACSRARR